MAIADEVITGVWGADVDSAPLGLIENGYTNILEYHDARIENTHLYQRSVLDLISQGGGSRTLFTCMARGNTAVARLMQKYDNLVGEMPSSGVKGSAHTFAFLLTALQGSVVDFDFSSGGPTVAAAYIEALESIVMEDWDFRNNLNAEPEMMQVQIRHLPYSDSGSVYFFRTNDN